MRIDDFAWPNEYIGFQACVFPYDGSLADDRIFRNKGVMHQMHVIGQDTAMDFRSIIQMTAVPENAPAEGDVFFQHRIVTDDAQFIQQYPRTDRAVRTDEAGWP